MGVRFKFETISFLFQDSKNETTSANLDATAFTKQQKSKNV